jgi:putative acetyltransferase
LSDHWGPRIGGISRSPGFELRSIQATHPGVDELLRQSTAYAASLYPAESNHLDGAEELSQENVYLVGVLSEGALVGMGAVKRLTHDIEYGEIKRLFVLPDQRGKGLARRIMHALERRLVEWGVGIARLETGIYQPEAIGLYKKLGYRVRDPFGAYKPDPLSVFMEKRIAGPCS